MYRTSAKNSQTAIPYTQPISKHLSHSGGFGSQKENSKETRTKTKNLQSFKMTNTTFDASLNQSLIKQLQAENKNKKISIRMAAGKSKETTKLAD